MTTRYTKDHEYIRVEGDTGTVGITDYAQQQLGDVVFVELPQTGKTLAKGAEAAVVESVKAASEIFAPVSGEVLVDRLVLAAVNRDRRRYEWTVLEELPLSMAVSTSPRPTALESADHGCEAATRGVTSPRRAAP